MYCFIICIVKLYENTECGSGGKDWPCLPMIRSFWVYIYMHTYTQTYNEVA